MSAAKHSASIIAIGSEMLGPTRVDTNSLKVTAAFESFGIGVVRKSVVGDTLDQISSTRSATRSRTRTSSSHPADSGRPRTT